MAYIILKTHILLIYYSISLSGSKVKAGVEVGVQVNLYEDAIWSLPPRLELNKDLPNSYSDNQLLDHIFEMEKSMIANDKLKAENDTMVAILESSLSQRKALKLELDKREEEIKKSRLNILQKRNFFKDGLKWNGEYVSLHWNLPPLPF